MMADKPRRPLLLIMQGTATPAAIAPDVAALLADGSPALDALAEADSHASHGGYHRDPGTGLIVCPCAGIRYAITPAHAGSAS
jgi:hypothetical protein